MRSLTHRVPVAALVLVLVACVDTPLPTQAPESPESAFFSRPPAPGFDAVARLVPLSQELVVSRIIGTEGGRMEIAEAGIALVVPEGALDAPVEITLTALAGREMAFEIRPSGLQLRKPATFELDVDRTEAAARLPTGGEAAAEGIDLDRFLGVAFDDRAPGVDPLEALPTYRKGGTVAFDVAFFRFSGYVCATG